MGVSSRASFGLGLVSGILLLVGCAAAVDVQVACLPLVVYTQAEQSSIQLAYTALPPGSILRRVVQDYLAMRDADRACRTATSEGSKP